MSKYATNDANFEEEDYEAGTFVVTSSASARTKSFDISNDTEEGVVEISRKENSTAQHQYGGGRVAQQMQWFNPQHVEKAEEVANKSLQREVNSPADFANKPPSQTQFLEVQEDRPHLLTLNQAMSQPRPLSQRNSNTSLKPLETQTTSYARPDAEPAIKGANAKTRAAYKNTNVGAVSAIGTTVDDGRRQAISRGETSPKADTQLSCVWNGSYLWKIPFNNDGAPRVRWFRAVHDVGSEGAGIYLKWTDPQRPRKPASDLALNKVHEVLVGQVTNAFFKQQNKRGGNSLPPPSLCFSLVTDSRTLDLAATEESEYNVWVKELREIVRKNVNNLAKNRQPPIIQYQPQPQQQQHNQYQQPHQQQQYQQPQSNSVHNQIQSNLPRPGNNANQNNNNNNNNKQQELKLTTQELRRFWRDTLFDHCRHNRLGEVQGIVNEGCPIDLMERETGDTALMVACRRGRTHIVSFCLTRGAKNDPHPQYGQTALQAGVEHGHAKCVQVILETAQKHKMDTVIVNHADPNKDAPLHVAARSGDTQTMEVLLRHGANYALVDANGRTPLHVAAAYDKEKAVALMVELVEDLDIGDHRGNTPLHLAATANAARIVKLLLQTAADPRCLNVESKTPLNVAQELRHTECIALLKEGMTNIIGTPRSTPFFRRCLKPGEEMQEPQRPMYKPDYHRGRVGSLNSVGSGGYSSDANSHYSNNSNNNGYHRSNSMDSNAQTGSGFSLFEGLDIAGMPSRHHSTGNQSNFSQSSDYPSGGYHNQHHQHQQQHNGYDHHNSYSQGDGYGITKQYSNESNDSYGSISKQYSNESNDSYYYNTEHNNTATVEQDYGSGVYIYTDNGDVTWECKYTEEGHAYYINGQTGESTWDDPCPEGYDGWHEMTISEWNAWNADPTYTNDGSYDQSYHQPTAGHYDTAAVESVDSPTATLGQRVRAQLARERALKSSRKKKSKSPTEAGATARDRVRRELAKARQATKDAEAMKNKLDVLQKTARAWEEKVPNNDSGDKEEEVVEEEEEEVDTSDPASALMAAIRNKGKKKKKKKKTKSNTTTTTKKKEVERPPKKEATGGSSGAEEAREKLREQDALKKFFNMEKMGIPLGAIRHKMTMDRIPEKDIRIFCKESNETAKPSLGGAGNLITLNTKAPSLEEQREKLREKGELTKFFSMEKMGIPIGAIRHKMTMDRIPEKDIKVFCREHPASPQGAFDKPQYGSPRKAMEAAKKKMEDRREAMKKEEKYTKYFKMEKMGIPLGGIRGKMVMDKMPADDIAAFCLETPKIEPPVGKGAASVARRMMKLNWETIPEDKLRNSVWGKVDTTVNHGGEEVNQLAQLFGKKTPQKRGSRKSKKKDASKKNARMSTGIDGKRLHNIEIGLAQFRAFKQYDDVVTAVCEMNEELLSQEKLQTLADISPTMDEVKKLKRCQNVDLDKCGKAEKWMFAAIRVPRFVEKVEAYRFKLTFNNRAKDLAKDISNLSSASDKVKSSKKLMSVLESVLRIGNLMNQGTHAGGASGFKLNSLMKLMQTKSHDKKTSVLDFIVQQALESDDPNKKAETEFPEDLKGIENAIKTDLKTVRRDFKNLQKGVNKMMAESHKGALEENANMSPRGEQFTSQCQKFVTTVASKVIQALETALEDVEEDEKSVVAYFGEDEKTTSASMIFDILHRFSSAYKRSANVISERIKRKERAAKRDAKRRESSKLDPGAGEKMASSKRQSSSPVKGSGGGLSLFASIKAKGGVEGLRQEAKLKEYASPNTMQRHELKHALIATLIQQQIEASQAKQLAMKLMKGAENPTISTWLDDTGRLWEALKKFGVTPKLSKSEERIAELKQMMRK